MGGVCVQLIGNRIEGEIGKCNGCFFWEKLGVLLGEKRDLLR